MDVRYILTGESSAFMDIFLIEVKGMSGKVHYLHVRIPETEFFLDTLKSGPQHRCERRENSGYGFHLIPCVFQKAHTGP